MHTVKLGPTGPTAANVALGTWPFAGDKIWGSSERSECIRVVHSALDHGITLFDTAPNYGDGRSESILGEALKGRSEPLVATKFKADNKSAQEIRHAVQESLLRLKRDAIDILQLHWPLGTSGATIEALDTFTALQKEGVVRHVGVCNFGVFDLAETADIEIVSNQIPYSLLWRVAESGVAEATHDHGAATIAYSPLQQGLLSGKYDSIESFPTGRKRTRHFPREWRNSRHEESGMERELESALVDLQELARRSSRSLLELSLAFVASRPFVDIVLVGSRSEEQLLQTVSACETDLGEDAARALQHATDQLKRACGGSLDMYQSDSRVRFSDEKGNPLRRSP